MNKFYSTLLCLSLTVFATFSTVKANYNRDTTAINSTQQEITCVLNDSYTKHFLSTNLILPEKTEEELNLLETVNLQIFLQNNLFVSQPEDSLFKEQTKIDEKIDSLLKIDYVQGFLKSSLIIPRDDKAKNGKTIVRNNLPKKAQKILQKTYVKSFLKENLVITKQDNREVVVRKEELEDKEPVYDTPIIGSEDNDLVSSNTNLDSLLNIWYLERVLAQDAADYKSLDGDIVEAELSDSLIIERLNKIPTSIEMPYNPETKKWIKAYTSKYAKKSIERLLGMADYYFPMFEEILDSYNIPIELKYLPIIESALNPKAVSWAGATGLWQFMYSTGKMYGLNVSRYVDERRDPVKATHAAARYLSKLYNEYHDWHLVLAAYNCGEGGVNRAVRKAGGVCNYWIVSKYLPRETRRYVPAFIAASYLMNYYREHNLTPRKADMPLVTDTVVVNQKIDLRQVAAVLDIPLNDLKKLNTQYKYGVVHSSKNRTNTLTLPVEYTMNFIELEDSIYNYKYRTTKRGRKALYASNLQRLKNQEQVTYKVKAGDNVGYIARWFNVRTSELKKWNNIKFNIIKVGQELTVYVPKKQKDNFLAVNTMNKDAKELFASNHKKITPRIQPSHFIDNTKIKGDVIRYTIRRGDNLWTIARNYSGVSSRDLMKWNNLNRYSRLKIGQIIKIKVK